jgi:ATP-binding cassette, subfamily C (CFTR/MRP), member 1
LVSTPFTSIFVRKLTQYRREMLKHTDQRVKLMNQLLVGIRVLKMYAWESAQEAAVLEVRKDELGRLRAAIPMRVGMQTLLFAAPTLAMVVCFVVYGSVEPQNFTPAAIFTSIALFALMRFPLLFLPFALVQLSNALVSMRRLSQYFLLEERIEAVIEMETPGIEIEGGEFFWADPPPKVMAEDPRGKKKKGGKKNGGAKDNGGAKVNGSETMKDASKDGEVAVKLPGMSPEGDAPAPAAAKSGEFWLRGVELSVAPGELVCVVGRVGSGKSSLVQAILGEMEASAGTVKVGGKVAYAAQQAWIINATVRENVTFGADFDRARWEDALEAACLAQDLEILPAGELTEIGEKGINLSGGQKQRVSLARALYQGADVYLLDDPLSAVDVHVGKHIFDSLIDGALKVCHSCFFGIFFFISKYVCVLKPFVCSLA